VVVLALHHHSGTTGPHMDRISPVQFFSILLSTQRLAESSHEFFGVAFECSNYQDLAKAHWLVEIEFVDGLLVLLTCVIPMLPNDCFYWLETLF
jgi:hypothetical protein